MENKEIKNSIPEELNEEELDLVAGGYQSFSIIDNPFGTPMAVDQPLFQATPPVEIAR